MDRKAFLVLLASFILLMLWYPLVNKYFPPTQLNTSTNLVSNPSFDTPTSSGNEPPRFEPAAIVPEFIAPEPSPINSSLSEKTLSIESDDAIEVQRRDNAAVQCRITVASAHAAGNDRGGGHHQLPQSLPIVEARDICVDDRIIPPVADFHGTLIISYAALDPDCPGRSRGA